VKNRIIPSNYGAIFGRSIVNSPRFIYNQADRYVNGIYRGITFKVRPGPFSPERSSCTIGMPKRVAIVETFAPASVSKGGSA